MSTSRQVRAETVGPVTLSPRQRSTLAAAADTPCRLSHFEGAAQPWLIGPNPGYTFVQPGTVTSLADLGLIEAGDLDDEGARLWPATDAGRALLAAR